MGGCASALRCDDDRCAVHPAVQRRRESAELSPLALQSHLQCPPIGAPSALEVNCGTPSGVPALSGTPSDDSTLHPVGMSDAFAVAPSIQVPVASQALSPLPHQKKERRKSTGALPNHAHSTTIKSSDKRKHVKSFASVIGGSDSDSTATASPAPSPRRRPSPAAITNALPQSSWGCDGKFDSGPLSPTTTILSSMRHVLPRRHTIAAGGTGIVPEQALCSSGSGSASFEWNAATGGVMAVAPSMSHPRGSDMQLVVSNPDGVVTRRASFSRDEDTYSSGGPSPSSARVTFSRHALVLTRRSQQNQHSFGSSDESGRGPVSPFAPGDQQQLGISGKGANSWRLVPASSMVGGLGTATGNTTPQPTEFQSIASTVDCDAIESFRVTSRPPTMSHSAGADEFHSFTFPVDQLVVEEVLEERFHKNQLARRRVSSLSVDANPFLQ